MMSKKDRKRLARITHDRTLIPSNTIQARLDETNKDSECMICSDAIERNGGKIEEKCKKCLIPPYICNGGKTGLYYLFRNKTTFGEIMSTPQYTLLEWESERVANSGECDLKGYVEKAEELGLGGMVTYWKNKLLEKRLDKLEMLINTILGVN